jgi:hypothetical protein
MLRDAMSFLCSLTLLKLLLCCGNLIKILLLTYAGILLYALPNKPNKNPPQGGKCKTTRGFNFSFSSML